MNHVGQALAGRRQPGVDRSGEFDDPLLVDRLLGRQHDPQAVHRRIHRFRQVEIFLDGLEEERLLAVAEVLVVRARRSW